MRGRPRVLVVEDNADMNRFVTQSLARDYDVTSSSTDVTDWRRRSESTR